MWIRRLLSVPAVLFLVGCNSESKVQEAVWKEVRDKLKAPSSAKIAEFKVYQVSENQKKAFFLQQAYDLGWCFRMRETIEKRGRATSAVFGPFKHFGVESEFRSFLSELRIAAPSQTQWLDEGESKGWDQRDAFSPKKNEISAVMKCIEGYIKKIATRELGRYDKVASQVQASDVFISYDAQNSYGAMLRGYDHFHVVVMNGVVRVIAIDDYSFVNSLVGLPDEPKL